MRTYSYYRTVDKFNKTTNIRFFNLGYKEKRDDRIEEKLSIRLSHASFSNDVVRPTVGLSVSAQTSLKWQTSGGNRIEKGNR